MARASRRAPVSRTILVPESGLKIKHRSSCQIPCNPFIVAKSYWILSAYRRGQILSEPKGPAPAIPGRLSHDRFRRQNARRTDGQYRFGLSEQQSDAGIRNSDPDQPGACRAAAGID